MSNGPWHRKQEAIRESDNLFINKKLLDDALIFGMKNRLSNEVSGWRTLYSIFGHVRRNYDDYREANDFGLL